MLVRMIWAKAIMRSLKELATQDLVLLVVSGGPHDKAFAFNLVDRCDRACGRVECFGQAELAEVGLAFPSVNVRHIVAGQGRASVLCLGD